MNASNRTNNKPQSRYLAVGLLCVSAVLCFATPVSAAPFDIPAQPLAAALRMFAAQSRMQLLYEADAVEGLNGNPVKGELDERVALERLLRNTGLETIFSSEVEATIRPARVRTTLPMPTRGDDAPVTRGRSAASVQPLEEVTVTAQRRAERYEDVPISVRAFDAEELRRAGIGNVRELELLTPGVTIPTNGAFIAPTIRGVSSEGAGPGIENAVAVYLDGVYQPSQGVAVFDLPDITNVQVLKGPQGTLYGRNATGGAILFTTADPRFDVGGRVALSYGRYDDVETSLSLTGPLLSDKLAASVAGYYRSHDGYVRDLLRGGHAGKLRSRLLRTKLLFTPNDALTFKLTGQYAQRRDPLLVTSSTVEGNSVARLVPGAIVAAQPYTSSQDPPSNATFTTQGMALHATWQGDLGTLTAITAGTSMRDQYRVNADYSSVGLVYYHVDHDQDVFTQDLMFASKERNGLSVLAGLSYLDDDGKLDPFRIVDVIQAYTRVTSEATSAFLEMDYALTERLAVVGGIRYSRETKNFYRSVGMRAFPHLADHTWGGITSRASVKYEISPSLHSYLTYSEGFRSGAFNPSMLQSSPADEETIRSYEIGLKSDRSGVLAFDMAAYLQTYSNMQVMTVQVGSVQLANAAEARIYGLDVNGTFAPSERISLRAGASYLRARYTNFEHAPVILPNPECPTGIARCGNITQLQDLSDTQPARAPSWTGFVSAEYAVPLGKGSLSMSALVSYNSGFYWTLGEIFKQSAYHVVNAQARWSGADERLTLSLWGKNLTDETYGLAQGIGVPAAAITWAPPRTVGVSVEYSF